MEDFCVDFLSPKKIRQCQQTHLSCSPLLHTSSTQKAENPKPWSKNQWFPWLSPLVTGFSHTHIQDELKGEKPCITALHTPLSSLCLHTNILLNYTPTACTSLRMWEMCALNLANKSTGSIQKGPDSAMKQRIQFPYWMTGSARTYKLPRCIIVL